MTERAFFDCLLAAWFALAAVVMTALFFITAPYGRHTRGGWGPVIKNKPGWFIMESVSPLVFLIFFCIGGNRRSSPGVVFLVMWEFHYLYRSFVYPLLLRGQRRHMPIGIMAMGMVFNTGNAYLNGRFLFHFAPAYNWSWFEGWPFLAGAFLFVSGFIIHYRADAVLRGLRASDADRYGIPQSALYRWISCPNYLGEIIEWTGWAVATWSLAGLAFSIWTIANLAPRARAHHLWYKAHFAEYPASRKALVPMVW